MAVSEMLMPQLEQKASSLDGLIVLLEESFRRLEADPALFRVIFAVPTRSRLDQATLFARLFRDHVARLSAADRRSAFAVIDLLGSPYAWDVMHRNWGLNAERSVRAVVVAIQALFDYLAREPTSLSPRSPSPLLSKGRRSR